MTTFETGNREEAIKYKFTLKECLFGDAVFYRRVAMVVVVLLPRFLEQAFTIASGFILLEAIPQSSHY